MRRADERGGPTGIGRAIAWCVVLCGVVETLSAQSLAVGGRTTGSAFVRADALLGAPGGPIPCATWHCVDSQRLRLQLRRELRAQALRGELPQQADVGSRRAPQPLYPSPRYLPPPTPAAQVQPRYRRSGEVRPEFLAGEAAR